MMKKILFALAGLVVIHIESAAQLDYGIKAGGHISDIVITNYINPDAESDYNLKLGFHAGAFARLQVFPRFHLGSDFQYTNRGVDAIGEINLHYISLSLLPLYSLSEKFMIELGPEFGYLFSAKSAYGNVSNIWNNKLDVGMDAGLYYKFYKKFTAGLRYYIGFSSVIDPTAMRDSNNIPTGETIKYQNRSLELSAYYTIGSVDY
jgi:hypothetical protein